VPYITGLHPFNIAATNSSNIGIILHTFIINVADQLCKNQHPKVTKSRGLFQLKYYAGNLKTGWA
jgi:hypothetical protein